MKRRAGFRTEPATAPGKKRIKLRAADTGRLRTYDVDDELSEEILQRLNDLALWYGVEVVSTCFGHDAEEEWERRSAVTFSVVYPQGKPWERERRWAQRCIETLAFDIAGEATEFNIVHDVEGIDRHGQLATSFLRVRHVESTPEDPERASRWWQVVRERLESRSFSRAEVVATAVGDDEWD